MEKPTLTIAIVGIALAAVGTGVLEFDKLYHGRGNALTVVSVVFFGIAVLCILLGVIHAIRKPPDA